MKFLLRDCWIYTWKIYLNHCFVLIIGLFLLIFLSLAILLSYHLFLNARRQQTPYLSCSLLLVCSRKQFSFCLMRTERKKKTYNQGKIIWWSCQKRDAFVIWCKINKRMCKMNIRNGWWTCRNIERNVIVIGSYAAISFQYILSLILFWQKPRSTIDKTTD